MTQHYVVRECSQISIGPVADLELAVTHFYVCEQGDHKKLFEGSERQCRDWAYLMNHAREQRSYRETLQAVSGKEIGQ